MPADHDTRHDTRPLGRTGIHVLPLGIGTNKWRRADRGAVLETYRTIHDAGPCMIYFFLFVELPPPNKWPRLGWPRRTAAHTRRVAPPYVLRGARGLPQAGQDRDFIAR